MPGGDSENARDVSGAASTLGRESWALAGTTAVACFAGELTCPCTTTVSGREGTRQQAWLAGIMDCPQCAAMWWQHSRSAGVGVTPGKKHATAGVIAQSRTVPNTTAIRTRCTFTSLYPGHYSTAQSLPIGGTGRCDCRHRKLPVRLPERLAYWRPKRILASLPTAARESAVTLLSRWVVNPSVNVTDRHSAATFL